MSNLITIGKNLTRLKKQMTGETTAETNNTPKGCSKTRILKYVQYFISFTSCTVAVGLLISQTYQALKVYLEEPTYTETLLYEQEDSTFPAITICPLDDGYNADILQVSKF